VALLSPVKDHVTHKTIKIKPQGNEKLHAMERKKSLQKLKKGPSLISRKESVGQFPSFEEFEDTKPSDHLNQNPKLDEFEVHVTKLNFDDIANYTGTEYQFIEDGLGDGAPKGTFNTALKVENRLKNRYTNVLPFDNNRVPIGENNEYINASWIHGEIPNTQKKYIATQGPLEHTISDFWRMVWETNSSVIVMLTNIYENERIKCSEYWPSEDSLSVEDRWSINLIEESKNEKLDKIFIRKFAIIDGIKNETKQVTQLHYTGWPDHGVPNTPEDFMLLAELSQQYNKSRGPIVTHCSAGIGRTGTYCVIQNIMQKINYEQKNNPNTPVKINVVRSLLKVREQRLGMVQTKDQYDFLYHAVLAGLKQQNMLR